MEMTIQTVSLHWHNNSNNGQSCKNDNDGKTNNKVTTGNLRRELVDKFYCAVLL